MLDKMKQLYDMQRKARALQKQLEDVRIAKSNRDDTLRLTVNGTQKVETVHIDPVWLVPEKKEALENALRALVNDTFADLQKQTAAQAAGLMKDLQGLNLPGMPGL